jgi:hypothetical protein
VHVLAALDDGERADESPALLVGEIHRVGVGHPEMDAATAGVDPEEVTIAKLIAYGMVENANCG